MSAAEGTTYGRYWHRMLASRGMLVLGLYRPVVQAGRRFYSVITNPPEVGVEGTGCEQWAAMGGAVPQAE